MLNRGTELLQFIDQKKQDKIDVNLEDIYNSYIDIIKSSILKSYDKLNHISFAISCTETTHLLFWIILRYSKNVKLTTFMCDRAIVLFNEYIKMSKSTVLGNDINLGEIKHFVYKKTIGPISISDIKADSYCTPEFEILSKKTLKLVIYWFRKIMESFTHCDTNIKHSDIKDKMNWIHIFCQKSIWAQFSDDTITNISKKIDLFLDDEDMLREKNLSVIQQQLNLKIITI